MTIMRPIAELDAGPICLQRAEPIAPDDDYGSLAARLAALGGELLVEALDTQPAFRDQPDQGVTYAEKIDAARPPARPGPPGRRAGAPRARAHAAHRRLRRAGRRRAARRAPRRAGRRESTTSRRASWPSATRGSSTARRQGALELLEVQPPGKRPMEAAAWLRGRAGRAKH